MNVRNAIVSHGILSIGGRDYVETCDLGTGGSEAGQRADGGRVLEIGPGPGGAGTGDNHVVRVEARGREIWNFRHLCGREGAGSTLERRNRESAVWESAGVVCEGARGA